MIRIAGLEALSNRLAQLDFSEIQHRALDQAAGVLQDAVREGLSHLPGSVHDTPWLRTGALRDSIEHQSDETIALIGSSDPVAVDQNEGTRTIPPRPFFAPAAAAHGKQLAYDVADAITIAIRQAMRGDAP